MVVWVLREQSLVEIAEKVDVIPSLTAGQRYVCVKRRQLPIRRFSYIDHAILDCLRLSTVVGERVSRRGGYIVVV